MPPLALAAGIGAVGSLAGGVLQNRSAGKAREAELTANREAMAFQREQAGKGEAAYKQQWDMWNANRNALMERYGIDITPPGMGAPPGAGPGPPPPGAAPPGAPPGAVPRGPAPTPGPTGSTLAELAGGGGDWSDWRQMGLGR